MRLLNRRWPHLAAESSLKGRLILVLGHVVPATCALLVLSAFASAGDDSSLPPSRTFKPSISGRETGRTQEDIMRMAWDDLDKAVQNHLSPSESAASRNVRTDSGPIGSQGLAEQGAVLPGSTVWENLAVLHIPQAEFWEKFFWGRTGTRLHGAINRLSKLQGPVDAILAKEGLPPETVAVAFVESAFDPDAVSSKGAVGIWQLMPATAKRYGLKPGPWNDERTDVQRSTAAAARYLADLHRLFGDWLLALAAYNAGEDAVLDAMARGKASDFWSLSEQGLLPEETRAYVPKVLGAVRALRRAKQFAASADASLAGPEAASTRAWFYTTASQR